MKRASWLFVLIFVLISVLAFCQENEIDKYLKAGQNYYEQGKFREAIAEWAQILALDPENKEANQLITTAQDKLIQIQMLTEELLEKERMSRQEQALAKRLEVGKDLYHRARFEDAIKEFVAVLQEDPTNEEANLYIDRAQIKIKEIKELSKALVREGKVFPSTRGIAGDIKPSYYDKKLNTFAEKMARLIEETKTKMGRTSKEEVLEKRKAEERFARVQECFEQGKRLYNEGKPKEAIATWEQALLIAKEGDPHTAQVIDQIRKKIEDEKKAQAKAEKEKALLAAKQKEEAALLRKKKEETKDDVIARRPKADEAIPKEEKRLLRPEASGLAMTGGARLTYNDKIIIGIIVFLVFLLLLIKPGKKIKPQEKLEKKEEKIVEKTKSTKDLFWAKKIGDVIAKRKGKRRNDPSSNDRRKNLFKDDD